MWKEICRLRWTNYLRPDLKNDSFSPQEEELIIQCHRIIGSRNSNHLVGGTTSSCSSSSSSASINQGAQAPVTTFCWSDYLLSDSVSPMSSQTQVVGS
ncbi:unnamed protein product, partial [Brassica rapa]